jgi:molybdopterin/thiamine biosynthesis adenylyltransferase
LSNAFEVMRLALAGNGFTPDVKASVKHPTYRGVISVVGNPLELLIEIVDPDFVDLPVIRLVERPASLPRTIPHLSADNRICYAAKGTLVLDTFDPGGQVLGCIERAKTVLELALAGKSLPDIQDEFFAYWNGFPTYVEIHPLRPGTEKSWIMQFKGETFFRLVVGNDEAAIRAKYEAMGMEVSQAAIDIHVIQGTQRPHAAEGIWPPPTVGALLDWLQELDPPVARAVRQLVDRDATNKIKGFAFLVMTPGGWYGAHINIKKISSHAKRSNSRNTSQRRNLERQRRNALPIAPLSPIRTDPEYIVQRNQPQQGRTLAGKKIYLVGCGTIGGYLGDLLTRAGAGVAGGTLVLVDPGTLRTENLGRHRLGSRRVGRNKAVALADELRHDFPGFSIDSRPVDARKAADLLSADVIIDATGEESLSNALNRRYSGTSFRPMLFAWVEGAGASAQAFLRDTSEHACYRCLVDRRRMSLYTALLEPTAPVHTGNGCEGYFVPFPATVSIQAAVLACNLALDWATGIPSPRFRTLRLIPNLTREVPDLDPPRYEGCPGCNI